MVVGANNYISGIAWCSHSAIRRLCNSAIDLYLVLTLIEQWKQGKRDQSHGVAKSINDGL